MSIRTIQCIPAIAKEASGPSYSVLRLCESLLDQGHATTLAALDWEPMPSPPAFLKTFPLGLGPPRLGRSPAMRRWLKAQVRSQAVELIHSHGMWQMNAVYPSWAANGTGVDLVVSPRGTFSEFAMAHGSVFKRVFWPLLQRPAVEVASCFHATADAEYQDIRRLGFGQPVAVIPNGIDLPPQFTKHPTPSRTLLFLGRIHKIKGLDMLLPAWGAVQNRFPQWRLVIAGGESGYYGKTGYLHELVGMARKLNLKRIEFAGEVRGQDKLDAFRAADVFVLPSYSENFGVAVAESLAAGTPAIVSRGAPWGGLVKEGAGWWIDASTESIVACLQEVLSTPSERLTEMGQAGRKWMEREFSWARIGAMMAGTYAWLREGGEVPTWVRVD